jgi:hypothetical protein
MHTALLDIYVSWLDAEERTGQSQVEMAVMWPMYPLGLIAPMIRTFLYLRYLTYCI